MKQHGFHALAVAMGGCLLLLGACGDGQSVELPDGGAAATVKVTYAGSSTVVDLGQPAPVAVGAGSYAKLSDVVTIAVTTRTIEQLQVTDLLAADGFSPLSRSNCAALFPVDGTLLAQGYIDPATGNLKWDDALTYPGCMSVTDTAEIVVEAE